MALTRSRPWLNGNYVGAGLCLPSVWQSWAVLGVGLLAALLSRIFLRGVAREIVTLVALLTMRFTIQVKRSE
jgi:hypothetical protein